MSIHQPNLDGTGLRIAVLASQFAEKSGETIARLRTDCVARLTELGTAEPEVFFVPGAFELPTAVRNLLATGKYQAIVALGAVVRGETPHFDYVAGECARGLAALGAETGVPVIFGVLATNTREQAEERSDKGREFADAAVQMARLRQQIIAA